MFVSFATTPDTILAFASSSFAALGMTDVDTFRFEELSNTKSTTT
jgi:hypothetical protein